MNDETFEQKVFYIKENIKKEEQKLDLPTTDITKIPIGIVLYLIGMFVVSAVAILTFDRLNVQSDTAVALAMLVAYMATTILLCVLLRKELVKETKVFKQSKWKFLGLGIGGWIVGFIVTIALGMIVLAINTALGKDEMSVNQESINDSIKNSAVIMAFSVIVFGPIVEELIFRKIIFAGLYQKNIVLAYAVSSLFFGAMHVFSGGDWVFLITYAGMGVMFAAAYHYSKNIYVPIIMHMIHNGFSFLMSLLYIYFG